MYVSIESRAPCREVGPDRDRRPRRHIEAVVVEVRGRADRRRVDDIAAVHRLRRGAGVVRLRLGKVARDSRQVEVPLRLKVSFSPAGTGAANDGPAVTSSRTPQSSNTNRIHPPSETRARRSPSRPRPNRPRVSSAGSPSIRDRAVSIIGREAPAPRNVHRRRSPSARSTRPKPAGVPPRPVPPNERDGGFFSFLPRRFDLSECGVAASYQAPLRRTDRTHRC